MFAHMLRCCAIVLVLLACAGGVSAQAAPLPPDGTLDASLGGVGWKTGALPANVNTMADDVAIDAQGRIVTVQEGPAVMHVIRLERWLPDGSLDPTFGTAGVATINAGGAATEAIGVEIDSQGRIVYTGVYIPANKDVIVGRVLPDGTPDPDFGVGGYGHTQLCATKNDAAYSLALQDDDKLLVGGYATRAGCALNNNEFLLMRYDVDGTLDATFGGGDGIVDVFSEDGRRSKVMDVSLQPDGRILTAVFGTHGGGAQPGDYQSVTRMLTDGTWDPSFGTNGRVVLPTYSYVHSVFAGPGGTVLAVGRINVTRATAVTRLLADGSHDPTFGTAGVAESSTATTTSYVGSAGSVLLPDGDIVTCSSSYEGAVAAVSHAAFVRFNGSDGSVDTTFGNAGTVRVETSPDPSGSEDILNCALDPVHHAIVAVGYSDQDPTAGTDVRPLAIRVFANQDLTPPVIAATADRTRRTMTVTTTASDADQGLHDTAFSFDGGTTWQASNVQHVEGLDLLESRTLSLAARDRAGNVATATITATTLGDDVNPVLHPPSLETTYDRVAITLSATDDERLHAAPWSFDDGASWQESPRMERTSLQPGTPVVLDVAVRDHAGNITRDRIDTRSREDAAPVVTIHTTRRSARSIEGLPTFTRHRAAFDVTNEWGAIVRVTASFGGRSTTAANGFVDLRPLPDGVGIMTVRVVDEDGDVGTTSNRVRIDRRAPTVRHGRYVLGRVVSARMRDAVAGTRTTHAVTVLPRGRLGRMVARVRVMDRVGNRAVRMLAIERRIALSDQSLNGDLHLRNRGGGDVSASLSAVRHSFRFTGYVDPWYTVSDSQFPFVREAQWRLVRLGCLAAGSYEIGRLDMSTIRAVQRYQSETRLPVLGTIGPRTRASLDARLLAGLRPVCR